jgi:hypothetical protein
VTAPFAVFPRGIDGLFLAHGPASPVRFLVEEGRPEHAYLRAVAPGRLIPYRLAPGLPMQALGTGEILRRSNIASAMARAGVSQLFLHTSRTPEMDRWARDTNVTLLAVRPRFARDFEHKIRFDAFLSQHGIAKPKSVSGRLSALGPLPFSEGAVAQIPQSMGGEGTFFLEPGEELQALLARGLLSRTAPCLVREWVRGEALGITLLITDALCALSSLRVQAYYPAQDGAAARVFAGVQWLPHAAHSPRFVGNAERVLGKLSRALHAAGFRGFANVDFMRTEQDAVRIIECNPRPSAATPSLYVWPELMHGLDVAETLLSAFRTRAKPGGRPGFLGLPATAFSGSTLDVPASLAGGATARVRRSVRSGVYRLRGQELAFIEKDPAALGPRGTVFVFGSVRRGERYAADDTLLNIYSEPALFTRHGRISARGKAVLAVLEVT